MPGPTLLPPSERFHESLENSWTATVIISYVVDWAILAGFAGVGYALSGIEPNKRPFSLLNPNISFPYTENETVPTWLLLVLCILLPAGTILFTCLVCIPAKTMPRARSRASLWKHKVWELHASLLGLALSVIMAWFITNGLKNMFGRPRPDLISRCQPDIQNLTLYVVGGALALKERASILNPALGIGALVSADICQQADSSKLDDGFRSSPSGHASAAAAGLIYLSFFLAGKLSVSIPVVPPQSEAASSTVSPNSTLHHAITTARQTRDHYEKVAIVRNQAAAPPMYLFCIMVIPFFISVFIAGSRWFDFRHHSSDIIFGYFIGALTSFFAFYYYHLPLGQGVGWAWGPRDRSHAWWSGIGSSGYTTGG